jgi:hypothetical protein
MKTLILAAARCSLIFTAVGALSLAYPASVQAVPTTYKYTGNHFTDVSGPYTTSMFVTAMVTLAGPLPANFEGFVTPLAFTFSDGVQTITNLISNSFTFFEFFTGPTGQIERWEVSVFKTGPHPEFVEFQIATWNDPVEDDNGDVEGVFDSVVFQGPNAFNEQQPGVWEIRSAVADTGTTLSLMTLSLMALGVATRQFKRASA